MKSVTDDDFTECLYFAVTDAQRHAVVGNGKRGHRKDIPYWKCQACGKKFSSHLPTPLYRLNAYPEKAVLVLMLLANGCDLSVLVRCTPLAEAMVTRWLERMGRHSQRLRKQGLIGLNILCQIAVKQILVELMRLDSSK